MNDRMPPSMGDPITMEVLRHRLVGIAEEMQTTLIRSSFSTIVKEGKDASASLFTLTGEPLAQSLSVPIHLGALIPMVQRLVATVSPSDLRDGDAYILNDPYLGGTHIPDIAVMMPVFCAGRPVGITAAMTHHADLGGMTPGSTPTNATEIFQEGIRIPLLKLLDGGKANETLMAILARNVRMPDTMLGDLNAQIAACATGRERLADATRRFGQDQALALFDQMLARSEQMTRRSLLELNAGTYRYEDFLDDDGIDVGSPIAIRVAVTIESGRMICDFAGTSDQVRGPFNCMPSGSLAAACFALRAVTDPGDEIPNNGGCFRAIELRIPEGSVLHPREPAPVGCRSATIRRVAGTLLGALRQAAPDRMPADSSGNVAMMTFAGSRASGTFVSPQMVVGGVGAMPAADGADVVDTDVTNTHNPAAEVLEMTCPVRVVRAGFHVGSGGPGMYRGGMGAEYEYEILQDDVLVTYRGERHRFSARGAEGGGSGARAHAVWTKADQTPRPIPSKSVFVANRGDRVTISTAGGGGFGDPCRRSPDAIARDIRDGKVEG